MWIYKGATIAWFEFLHEHVSGNGIFCFWPSTKLLLYLTGCANICNFTTWDFGDDKQIHDWPCTHSCQTWWIDTWGMSKTDIIVVALNMLYMVWFAWFLQSILNLIFCIMRVVIVILGWMMDIKQKHRICSRITSCLLVMKLWMYCYGAYVGDSLYSCWVYIYYILLSKFRRVGDRVYV